MMIDLHLSPCCKCNNKKDSKYDMCYECYVKNPRCDCGKLLKSNYTHCYDCHSKSKPSSKIVK